MDTQTQSIKLIADNINSNQPCSIEYSESHNELNIIEKKVLDGPFSASKSELNLTIDIEKTTANSFGIKLQNDAGENLLVSFNKSDGMMYVDRTNSSKHKFSDDFFKKVHVAPVDFEKEKMNIRLIIDV